MPGRELVDAGVENRPRHVHSHGAGRGRRVKMDRLSTRTRRDEQDDTGGQETAEEPPEERPDALQHIHPLGNGTAIIAPISAWV